MVKAGTDWEHKRETGLKEILSHAKMVECMTHSSSPGILLVVKDLSALASWVFKGQDLEKKKKKEKERKNIMTGQQGRYF